MSILFTILAAIFKAISDTLKDHFSTSVFKWKDPRFWNPDVSWEYAPFLKIWFIKTRYHLDAWHLSNSAMIVCFLSAVAFSYDRSFSFCHGWVLLILLGIVFNLTFNLFYNKILRK